MDATDRMRDAADEWHDMGQPTKLRRSTAYTLCDIADAARDAATHLRNRERSDSADGYPNSAGISGAHAYAIERALARLDGDFGR